MTLIPDWKTKITGAWSSRLALVGVLLSAGDALLPQLDGVIPRGLFVALYIGIFAVRVIYQESLHDDADATEQK